MNLHAEDIYSIGVAHGPAGPAVAGPLFEQQRLYKSY